MTRDELFRKGVELFNDRNYHEGHEFWEDLWRDEPHPDRLFHQGLIQLCAGLLHLEWGHPRGARNHYTRATDKLRRFPEVHEGILLGDLLRQIDAIFDEHTWAGRSGRRLEAGEAPRILWASPAEAPIPDPGTGRDPG